MTEDNQWQKEGNCCCCVCRYGCNHPCEARLRSEVSKGVPLSDVKFGYKLLESQS